MTTFDRTPPPSFPPFWFSSPPADSSPPERFSFFPLRPGPRETISVHFFFPEFHVPDCLVPSPLPSNVLFGPMLTHFSSAVNPLFFPLMFWVLWWFFLVLFPAQKIFSRIYRFWCVLLFFLFLSAGHSGFLCLAVQGSDTFRLEWWGHWLLRASNDSRITINFLGQSSLFGLRLPSLFVERFLGR